MSVAAVPVVDFTKRRRRLQSMRAVDDGLRFVERTNVELRHIRYYIAVAEEQSIRRAAIRLNMAAPPLSVQMQKLEMEVGARLLIREKRKISLTEAGEVFLQHARRTLEHVYCSIAQARQVEKNQVSHLTIGYNAVAEHGALAHIVREFQHMAPQTRFTFRSLRTADQVQALIRHEIDVGFVCPPIGTDAFEMTELGSQPFVVLLPSGHRLASHRSLSFRDLSSEPLILYSRSLDPNSFREIEDCFLNAGASLSVVHELESPLSMAKFAADGHGCCIAPEYVHTLVPTAVCRPLGPPTILRTLAVCMHKGAGKLPQSFYRFVADHWCK
jgi:DNA-binding transcriptional LysR family regulator